MASFSEAPRKSAADGRGRYIGVVVVVVAVVGILIAVGVIR
jgi:hypothetical protein